MTRRTILRARKASGAALSLQPRRAGRRRFIADCIGGTTTFVRAWYRSWFGFSIWLLLAILAVLAINRLPQELLGLVTMTIDSSTGILEFDVTSDDRFSLPLPAGRYGLFSATSRQGCEQPEPFDIVCAYPEPTTIEVDGNANVHMSILQPEDTDGDSAFPRLFVVLTPLGEKESLFRIKEHSDRVLVESGSAVSFESAPVRLWRAPLDVSNVILGRSLREGGTDQPMMTEGGVRFFARINAQTGRFLVKSEQLDPADIVPIETDLRCPLTRLEAIGKMLTLGLFPSPRYDCSHRLVGPVTLGGAADPVPRAFHVTLHANQSTLDVRRRGGGYIVRTSNWDIVSAQPALLALWAVFISLMLIVTYVEGHKASADFARAAVERGHEKSSKFRRSRQPG